MKSRNSTLPLSYLAMVSPLPTALKIDAYQGYIRDLSLHRRRRFRKQGLTPEQTAQRVDLTAYRAHFTAIQGPGADVRAVRSIYEWLDGRRR